MRRALITVYYPSDGVKSNVTKVAKQVDVVYICDNSPSCNNEMFASGDGLDNVKYIWFGENLGLSRAFNSVLEDVSLSWNDDDYVVFFDQDSSIEEGHIDSLIAEFEKLQALGHKIGCLGPVYFNTSSGCVERPKMKTPLNETSFAVSSIITSSMLCTYVGLRRIGFWNENVFLDMADWDICWRMRKSGQLCCLTEVATLHHSLGNGEKKIGPLRLRVGSPFREYYQIREALFLLTQSYTPLKFRIRFVAMIFVRSPLHILFLEHRKERIKYISMGVRDFFKKEHGALKL